MRDRLGSLSLLATLLLLGACDDDDQGPDTRDVGAAEVVARPDATAEAGHDVAAEAAPDLDAVVSSDAPDDAGAPGDSAANDLPPPPPEEPANEDPVCTPAPCKWKSVGLGHDRACTVTEDGQARCWGFDSGAARLPPGKYRQVFPISKERTLALTDSGRLFYLGGGPPLILPLDDRLTTFVTSGGDGCGLRADRTIVCWSLRSKLTWTPPGEPVKTLHAGGGGYCALRDDGAALSFPDLGPAQPGPFTQVACGTGFTCGLRTDDTLACWTPDGGAVPTPSGRYRKVAPADSTLCVLTLEGAISCWDPLATDDKKNPVAPVAGSFVDLHHQRSPYWNKVGCGVLADGPWRCWGDSAGSYGETTRPEDDDHVLVSDYCALTRTGAVNCWRGTLPSFSLSAGTDPFVELDEGENWGCALTAAGSVRCFDRRRAPRPLPVSPPGRVYQGLRVERDSEALGACALRKDTRELECWPARPRPGLPSGPLKNFSLGVDSGCAIRDDGGADGPLVCWSPTGDWPLVASAPTGRRWKQVVVESKQEACAIDLAGEISCWGTYGPIAIPKGPFTAIASTVTDWMALREDGTLAPFGSWSYWYSVPRLQTGKFVSLARNGYCALTDKGRIKCWGHIRR